MIPHDGAHDIVKFRLYRAGADPFISDLGSPQIVQFLMTSQNPILVVHRFRVDLVVGNMPILYSTKSNNVHGAWPDKN
jgi:hypothetical protein